jgi:hypothetical protein
MKKLLLIICFLISICASKAQTNEDLLLSAQKAYWSADYRKAYSLFSSLDSTMHDFYYYDLWYYYVSSEMVDYYYHEIVVDSAKVEELLYRLVQSNGIERRWLNSKFTNDIKLHERSYWSKLDSLITITETDRCQPFIDSLAAMVELDQSVRNMNWTEETMKLAEVVDSTNTAKLKQLIEQYGFPTWELVGQYGQMNAWVIAQHSSEYLPHFLKQYRKAVEENNATRRELAYLEDRYLIESGRPQIYGTQFFYNVKDSTTYLYATVDMEHLDDRRISVDLYSMDEYLKRAQLGNVDLYTDTKIQAMTSYDTLVKFLNSGSFHLFGNNHIKKLISKKAETLTKDDYQDFFSWLFKQVETGNYHLFDYAELYDEVHYRLFKTSYYGQKDFGKKVRIYKPKQLESRRSEIKLQSLELISNE